MFKGDADLELNISSTVLAGETVHGRCLFSGGNTPRYIHVRAMGQNCTVSRETSAGKNISNFNITCLSKGVQFDLECFTNNRNEKTVKRIEGTSVKFLCNKQMQ